MRRAPIQSQWPPGLIAILERSGEMGRLIRDFDWSSSPLGEPSMWPADLSAAVGTMLANEFPVAIAWGPEFTLFYNDAYRPILGSTKHPGALGSPTQDIFPEIWEDVVGPLFHNAHVRGEATFAENLLLPLDRNGFLEECYFTFCYSAIPLGEGGNGGVLVTVVETTKRVMAERRLALLHDLAGETGLATTQEEVCQSATSVLAAHANVVPFALCCRVDHSLDGESCPEPILAAMTRVKQSGVAETVEGVDLGAEPPFPGAPPPFAAVVAPVDAPPTAVLVLGVNPARPLDEDYRRFLDVVNHHCAAALSRARLLEEERARAAALSELDRAKTEFFTNVSHEFRTPLTLLLGPLEEELSDPAVDPELRQERLAVAHRNATRLLKLVNVLLDYSRLQAGRLQAVFEPVDLAAFTAELASPFRSVANHAGLDLEINTLPLPDPVYVDRDLWERIVFNLLSNAVKFTHRGSITITVRSIDSPKGAAAQLIVSDTGIGIPESELTQLFERFHQVAGAEGRSREGAGIGLSLVAELAALHGGRVTVESRPGHGSSFAVTLPFGADHLEPHRMGTRQPLDIETSARPYVEEAMRWVTSDGVTSAVTAAPGAIGRVLVVDDNADMRAYVVQLLGAHWTTEEAPDGLTALEAIRSNAPDAVLVDVMLPGIDGITLVRQLREDPRTRHIPVVMLSARAGAEAAVQGLSAGADDYLVKPFIAAELIARVNTQVQLGRARRELSARAALLAAQIESAPQGILAVSPDGHVLAANRRFEELWRLPPGSVRVGDPSPALQEPTLSQILDPEQFQDAIRWGHAHSTEMQRLDVPLLDGRVIEGVSSPIFDETGVYHGRIWFLNDDTVRRRAEANRTALVERLQAAQRSQGFLLRAAQAIARASGYAETLRELAAVAVPTLGDICLIDVTDEMGDVRRVAARHADPTRQPLVDELGRRYPPDADGLHPSVDVVRSRRSRWSDSMSDEFLRATTRDEHHYQLTKQLQFTSYMSVPLVSGDDVLGAITLVSGVSGRRFGPEDLALAEDLASQVALVAAKARRHEQDQEAAHTLQASLLPPDLPVLDGLTIAVRYLPGTTGAEVGGDWYDVISLDSGAAALAVGDVAGHDIRAAAGMGALRWAARALMRHTDSAAGLLELLHDSWGHLGVEQIATCVVARLDPRTGQLSVATAGHPPPLLLAGGRASFIPVEPSSPLGSPATPVPDFATKLHPGAVVLFYTDGVVEERHRSLDEGMARLLDVAQGGLPDPEALCDRVLAALAQNRSDDVALLAVRYDGPTASP